MIRKKIFFHIFELISNNIILYWFIASNFAKLFIIVMVYKVVGIASYSLAGLDWRPGITLLLVSWFMVGSSLSSSSSEEPTEKKNFVTTLRKTIILLFSTLFLNYPL